MLVITGALFIHENIKPIKGKFTKGGIILTSLL